MHFFEWVFFRVYQFFYLNTRLLIMFCDTDIYVNVERKIFNKKYKISILCSFISPVLFHVTSASVMAGGLKPNQPVRVFTQSGFNPFVPKMVRNLV